MSKEATHILEPGELFADRYEIERRIGIGGFGSVYCATDTNLRRQCALKVLDVYQSAPNPRAAQQIRKRFEREAMIAGTIQHPGIVQVFDAGDVTHNGWECLYLVMELLDGWNLEDHLYRYQRFEAKTLLPMFHRLLLGIASGHARDIVHKDLKPGNIFYHCPNTPDQRLVVFDFGIARILHDERYTATGHLVGTPQYLAPEYILDQSVTPRFDVYQLGLILCELLMGVPVVSPSDSFIGTCQAHVNGEVELPKQILDTPLGPIVRKACEPNPDDRYAEAGEFAEALAKLVPYDFDVRHRTTSQGVGQPLSVPTMPLSSADRDEIRADASTRERRPERFQEFSPSTAKTIRAQLQEMREERVEGPLDNGLSNPTDTLTAESPSSSTQRNPLLIGLIVLLVALLLLGLFVLTKL